MSFYLPFKWLYSFIFALLPELPSSCQNAVRPLLASRETCVPKEGVFRIDGSQSFTNWRIRYLRWHSALLPAKGRDRSQIRVVESLPANLIEQAVVHQN